tara:strand:- start:23175 stop:24209 length:1035 start_codon:yes stop_codon:yes gene_type:complete
MAKTLVSDVVVPSVFVDYVIERTAEKSRLIQSGIMAADPQFDALANQGGKTIEMPFWQDLDGDDEVLDDSSSMTPGKIGASQDAAAKMIRGRGWSYNDLAGMLAGDDPGRAIGELVSSYKSRRLQKQLLSMLTGIFGSGTGLDTTNTKDLHITSGGGTPGAGNILNASTFLDAQQLLGDEKDRLTGILMHSQVETLLRKLDLIDFIPDSVGTGMTMKVFQGLEVIVDDSITTETVDSKTVYHSFLFGQGAIAFGTGRKPEAVDGAVPGSTWEVEFSRDAAAGDSNLWVRWLNIMHPRGVKFTDSSVAGHTPSNAELATAANWTRVYEAKNVRIVRIRSNVLPTS